MTTARPLASVTGEYVADPILTFTVSPTTALPAISFKVTVNCWFDLGYVLRFETVKVVFDGMPGIASSSTANVLETLSSKLTPLVGKTAVTMFPVSANSS